MTQERAMRGVIELVQVCLKRVGSGMSQSTNFTNFSGESWGGHWRLFASRVLSDWLHAIACCCMTLRGIVGFWRIDCKAEVAVNSVAMLVRPWKEGLFNQRWSWWRTRWLHFQWWSADWGTKFKNWVKFNQIPIFEDHCSLPFKFADAFFRDLSTLSPPRLSHS